MKNKNRPDTDLSHASTFPTVHMLLEFQTLVNHAISLWLAVPRFPNRHLRNHAGTLTRPGQSIERLAFLKAPNPYPRIVQAFFVRCSSVRIGHCASRQRAGCRASYLGHVLARMLGSSPRE